MIEKEFVPYEQALALKELGFDEPCFATYDEDENFELQDFFQTYETFPSHIIAAPTYSQAFRWFRENYNLKHDYGVFPHHTIMYNYIIEGGKEEEAELACLIKLIEIVKNQ